MGRAVIINKKKIYVRVWVWDLRICLYVALCLGGQFLTLWRVLVPLCSQTVESKKTPLWTALLWSRSHCDQSKRQQLLQQQSATPRQNRSFKSEWFIIIIIIGGRDSSVGIATRYGLDGPGIESRWGRFFPHPSWPALGPTQPTCDGCQVFPGGTAAGAWRWPPTPSSTEVKERVGLYLYSSSGTSWLVLGWTLPLLLSTSSSSSPLCRVLILIFLRQTMSLGNTVLQLFCCVHSWCLYRYLQCWIYCTFTLVLCYICVQCPIWLFSVVPWLRGFPVCCSRIF